MIMMMMVIITMMMMMVKTMMMMIVMMMVIITTIIIIVIMMIITIMTRVIKNINITMLHVYLLQFASRTTSENHNSKAHSHVMIKGLIKTTGIKNGGSHIIYNSIFYS